jgi:2'-phosphotransferase
MVLRLVKENAKQRFEVQWGYDPSPPRSKPAKGKGKAKINAVQPAPEYDGGKEPLAVSDATMEDLGVKGSRNQSNNSVELPLVIFPGGEQIVGGTLLSEDGKDDGKGEWWIRATQGHSIQLESTSHLEEVKDDEEGRKRAGVMVHGTRWELWDILSGLEVLEWSTVANAALEEEGLSKMTRQHIHLAPAISTEEHRITPRPTSTLFIYLDLRKMAAAGIPVYTSLNGVILTPGDESGFVTKQYWAKAERVVKGERILVWEDGRDVKHS